MARKWRRQAREAVLKSLYEFDLVRHLPEVCLERQIEYGREGDEEFGTSLSAQGQTYARALVRGIRGVWDFLGELIQEAAPHWDQAQLAVVDRNILRLAIYEMLEEGLGVPMKVAINEAVELAKQYGSEGAPRFVNGVLGWVARNRHRLIQEYRRRTAPETVSQSGKEETP